MSGICRCGARLLASVTFCVECGASVAVRPVLAATAASTAAHEPVSAPGFGASAVASGLPHPPYAAPSNSWRLAVGSSWSRGPWIAAMTSAAVLALLVLVAFVAARSSAPMAAEHATPVASASPPAAAGSSYAPYTPGSSSPANTTSTSGSEPGQDSCTARTTDVFTRLARGQITLSQARSQLPQEVPPSALINELDGVRRLEADGASPTDAMSQAAGTLAQSCP